MTDPGRRREARERVLELLYEAEAKGWSIADLLAELPVEPDPFALRAVRGVEEEQDEIDALLVRFLRADWSLDRLPDVDRHVLRLATWELLSEPATPVAVVLAEAVALAKRYSTEASGRFVNGVLASIADEVR